MDGRAIASKCSDIVQLRSTTVATVTGMGWIVSRARSRLRIPENTAFRRCFAPDYDHVFRSIGFRCDCPAMDGGRLEDSNNLLFQDLSRQDLECVTVKAGYGMDLPVLGPVTIPIYVKRANGTELFVGLL